LKWTFVLKTLAFMVILLFALFGVAFLFFQTDRSTVPLDTAPEELIVPGYFEQIMFRGQGYPVNTKFIIEGVREYNGTIVFVLPHMEELSYKNLQETEEQVRFINEQYRPDPAWRYRPERRMGHYKCLSMSMSTIIDYHALERNKSLEPYVSIFDGKEYRGFDPKALDSLYYQYREREPEFFKVTEEGHLDPITNVSVPYVGAGFAKIVEEQSAIPGVRSVQDYNLPVNYAFSFDASGPLRAEELAHGEVFWKVLFHLYPRPSSERLKAAIEQGPVLGGVKVRFAALDGIFRDTRLGDFPIKGLTGHGVMIVGYVEQDGKTYFLYRETFGKCNEELPECGPAYRILPIYGFNELIAFERLG